MAACLILHCVTNAGWHQLKQPQCYLVIAGPSVLIFMDTFNITYTVDVILVSCNFGNLCICWK